jgi:hypothetical protein
MAQPLCAANATFRSELFDLDDRAKGLLGHSIVDVLYDPAPAPSEPFDRTSFTHPAVLGSRSPSRALASAGVAVENAALQAILPIDDA